MAVAMENGGSFSLLVDLAKEKSSEKRRELLRQVSDAFLTGSSVRSEREAELFDEIVGVVATDLEVQVRIELAKKVATNGLPVRKLARRLAFDTIEVARPVIESSPALTQTDLVDVIQQTSQDHMMAVTKRPDIGEKVSSALVAKGSDYVIAALLDNPMAQLSRETFERVTDRVSKSPVLHSPFVRRKNVPLDLLNDVYLKVSASLRKQIISKYADASPAEIEAALAVSREYLANVYGALPGDYALAKEYVDDLIKRNALRPSSLESMLRDNQRTSFLIAFSKLVDVDFELASKLVDSKDVDALAMLCRSASFDQQLFVTLCTMIMGGGGGLKKAEQYGQLYGQVAVASAQRAVRFWKVRSKVTASETAAARDVLLAMG